MPKQSQRSVWTSRFVRALAGQCGAGDNPMVVQSLGQFIPISRSVLPDLPGPRVESQDERLSAWSRPGLLTYGEAEVLLALDETTRWRRRF